MGFDEEETRCLRLQHQAERTWLRLRGCPESELDALVESRRRFRADTLARYKKKMADALAKRELSEKRIRSFQRKLDGPSRPWIRRDATDHDDWQRWKDTAQVEYDEAVAEVKWLSEILRGLSPWERPLLIVRKTKIGERASDAVKAVVSHMAHLIPIPVAV